MLVNESDWAKYPFTTEAGRYIQDKGPEIQDLSPDFLEAVNTAIRRVEEALEEGIHTNWKGSADGIEILAYPIAVMIVMRLGDPFLKRRYALAEAKRAYKLLLNEPPRKSKEHLSDIAVNTFGWKLQQPGETVGDIKHDFLLSFTDYLRNAVVFHEDKWKLVNKLFVGGYVYLTTVEAARLLQEEIQRRIERKLDETLELELPSQILQKMEPLKLLLAQRKGEITMEEAPPGFIVTAFPPCINRLYDAVFSGQPIPHLGRFTLTSFLLAVGLSADDVVNLFSQLADYNSEMTRYQVEHIAGTRGSRTKYTSPNCDTLRTHGFCLGATELCRKGRHPLTYYRRKLRMLKTTTPSEGG